MTTPPPPPTPPSAPPSAPPSTPTPPSGSSGEERLLAVLVIDDERPALDELTYLLRRDPRVGEVHGTCSPTDALRLLQQLEVDAVFLDVQMPGLSGIDLAQVLSRFRRPPATVFVTAHDEHAVAAFDLDAVDYVLKPVREERLADAVRRVVAHVRAGRSSAPTAPPTAAPGSPTGAADPGEEQVAVERGGVTRFVPVSRIRHVEAEGDYARLHVDGDSHLVRMPLSQLEQDWAGSGFVRIHRSLLINTAYVEELHVDAGRCWVVVDGTDLQVSRRHTRELRDLLVRRGRAGTRAAASRPGGTTP